MEAFETYRWHVEEDRRSGLLRDRAFDMHPHVTTAANIWEVLLPLRLRLADRELDDSLILSLNVDWLNPHGFFAYFRDWELYQLTVEG